LDDVLDGIDLENLGIEDLSDWNKKELIDNGSVSTQEKVDGSFISGQNFFINNYNPLFISYESEQNICDINLVREKKVSEIDESLLKKKKT